MIFYAGRNPDTAEKKGYALTNTAWTYNLMAVTDEKNFDEGNVYTVAVPKEKEALKQQLPLVIHNGILWIMIRLRRLLK